MRTQTSSLRFWSGFVLIALVAMVISACVAPAAPAPASSTGNSSAAAAEKPLIALIVGVKGDPFCVTMEKGARAKAEELGGKLLVDGPVQFDPTLQTSIVDAMIAATDKQARIEPMQRAYDAGIAVISVDTFIGDGDYDKGSVTFPLSYIGIWWGFCPTC